MQKSCKFLFSEITRLSLACSVFILTRASTSYTSSSVSWMYLWSNRFVSLCAAQCMMRQFRRGCATAWHWTTTIHCRHWWRLQKQRWMCVGKKDTSAKGSLTSQNRNLYTQTQTSISTLSCLRPSQRLDGEITNRFVSNCCMSRLDLSCRRKANCKYEITQA